MRIEEDIGFSISQGREEQPPTGKLSEVYALLGKGLSLGQIANELRIKERKLRWLLKAKQG
jgi:DNA-binding NarL/FixJ family response regulator